MAAPLFLDGIEPFPWPLAASTDLAAACGRVADHGASLLPAERHGLRRMAVARAAAYSSGRRAAHAALSELALGALPVATRNGAPLWPRGVVGSIAHSRDLVLALVGRRRSWFAIGVDLETQRRVGAKVAERVLNDRERRHLTDATALFSAKEAVYKAVNPLLGEFLSFRDVEITPRAGTFLAATTRPCRSTAAIRAGTGYLLRAHGHWLTIFTIPATASGARNPEPHS